MTNKKKKWMNILNENLEKLTDRRRYGVGKGATAADLNIIYIFFFIETKNLAI